jgi:hypothetical protein
MTAPWWREALQQQQQVGFADLSGSEGSAVIPVSDRLLTSIAASRMPASAPVRSLQLFAEAEDRFAVRVKLTTPALLPAFTVRFAIIEQPRLPEVPVLVLWMMSDGIGVFIGPLLRMFAKLPPWVRFDGSRLHVDIRMLAAEHGVAGYLQYVTELRVTTTPGRFVLAARGGVPRGR